MSFIRRQLRELSGRLHRPKVPESLRPRAHVLALDDAEDDRWLERRFGFCFAARAWGS